jgi:hypothetical protein
MEGSKVSTSFVKWSVVKFLETGFLSLLEDVYTPYDVLLFLSYSCGSIFYYCLYYCVFCMFILVFVYYVFSLLCLCIFIFMYISF